MSKQPITCEEAISRLFEYLDGELDSADKESIEHHLEVCRNCFGRAEFERRLRAKLTEAAEVEAPESLRTRVRGLIARF